jgi:hypothetical protein
MGKVELGIFYSSLLTFRLRLAAQVIGWSIFFILAKAQNRKL